MAVTQYNIQALRNEVYAGGGPTDLAHYGQQWFGRNNCSLSEFLNKSWWKSVSLGLTSGQTVTVPDRGTQFIAIEASFQTTGEGGSPVNNPGSILMGNVAAWNSFNYVVVPGIGNVVKASFAFNGTYWAYSIAYPYPSSTPLTFWYAPI